MLFTLFFEYIVILFLWRECLVIGTLQRLSDPSCSWLTRSRAMDTFSTYTGWPTNTDPSCSWLTRSRGMDTFSTYTGWPTNTDPSCSWLTRSRAMDTFSIHTGWPANKGWDYRNRLMEFISLFATLYVLFRILVEKIFTKK